MDIKINILEDENVKIGNTYHKKVKGGGNKSDGVMINIFKETDGIDYAHVVLPTGEIKRIATTLIEVVDKDYV